MRLLSVFPLFVISYDPRSLLASRAWVICHSNGSHSAFSRTEEGRVKGVNGWVYPARCLGFMRCPPCRLLSTETGWQYQAVPGNLGHTNHKTRVTG
jgi:hypothetical protein